MLGQMMNVPLSIPAVLEHAAAYHGQVEIVSRSEEGPIHRTTYAALRARTHQLANALLALGLRPGERVGTLAWNTYRHLELYFAVPGAGFVCHTTNPRLFADQVAFIVNDAADRAVFVDLSFVKLAEQIAPLCPAVTNWVILTDRAHMPETTLPNALCYEELLAAQAPHFVWPTLDENTASGMCYTSGTTGNPKGVLYSHRSTLLHAFAISHPNAFCLSARDVVMPVVPMFHVNSWCLPYAAPIAGAKLVLPGAKLDGASVSSLIMDEGVTATAGVPTVWLALLNYADTHNLSLKPLDRVVVGGSACPQSLFERFAALGARVIHAWGMTEMSPVGSVCILTPEHDALPIEEQMKLRIKQGRAPFGVELRITGLNGEALPWDGTARGMLEVRGPWVTSGYFNNDDRSAFSADGWFATGDVATITPDGFMEIVDRTKDVIKSGGEWISSIALENAALGHPAVREAAAIAKPDPKWGERPRLVLVLKEGAEVTAPELRGYFEQHIAKWCVPDDVVIVDDLPHTATGKLFKMELRKQYSGENPPGLLKL